MSAIIIYSILIPDVAKIGFPLVVLQRSQVLLRVSLRGNLIAAECRSELRPLSIAATPLTCNYGVNPTVSRVCTRGKNRMIYKHAPCREESLTHWRECRNHVRRMFQSYTHLLADTKLGVK